MIIDEIVTTLREWRGDNEDKSYLLIAVDEEDFTAAVLGNCFLLGAALAAAMNEDEKTERIGEMAMTFKEMGLFNDQDNDRAETSEA